MGAFHFTEEWIYCCVEGSCVSKLWMGMMNYYIIMSRSRKIELEWPVQSNPAQQLASRIGIPIKKGRVKIVCFFIQNSHTALKWTKCTKITVRNLHFLKSKLPQKKKQNHSNTNVSVTAMDRIFYLNKKNLYLVSKIVSVRFCVDLKKMRLVAFLLFTSTCTGTGSVWD